MALNSIKELRIWCQKVLPLVYDDSLSYYEVLTKVVNKLNEVIALAQEQNETIEEALSDIDTFKTDMTSQFGSYKTTLNAALDAFETEITAQQSGFEGRMTQEFADFLADYEREFGITNLYGDSTTLAISQNQVSKLLDYTTNNNRFNPEVITSGKAIDNTGAVVDSANTAVTGYIEVQPGENIVAQAKNNTTNVRYQGAGTGTDVPLVFDSIAGYDEDLTFVSGSYKSLVFNYQVPVGVKYIKLAMGQTILDGTNTDMSELAIVNSDGTIYPYQPYSEQNATVKMNALPVDDTTVGNHLWTANKINAFQAAVEGEIDTLQTASEEHTTAISNLQAKDAELVGDINGLTTRISSAEGDIELLEGRADTLEPNVDKLEESTENIYDFLGNSYEWLDGYYALGNGVWTQQTGNVTYHSTNKITGKIPELTDFVNSDYMRGDSFFPIWFDSTYKGYLMNGVWHNPNGSIPTITLDYNNYAIVLHNVADYENFRLRNVALKTENDSVKTTADKALAESDLLVNTKEITNTVDIHVTINNSYGYKVMKKIYMKSYTPIIESGNVMVYILKQNADNTYSTVKSKRLYPGDSYEINEILDTSNAILLNFLGRNPIQQDFSSVNNDDTFSKVYGWNGNTSKLIVNSNNYYIPGTYVVYDPITNYMLNYIDDGNPCNWKGTQCSVFDNLLCIGDSITQGAPTPPDITPDPSKATRTVNNQIMYSYPSSMKKQWGVECTNWGRSGISSQGWYDYYSVNEPSWSGHDGAIMLIGNNDYHLVDDLGGLTEETLPIAIQRSKAAMMSIITKLKADNADIKIFICTLLPNWDIANSLSPHVCDNIRDIASTEENVFLIDLSKYSKIEQDSPYSNGHPTALGYNQLAREIGGAIGYTIVNKPDEFRWIQFIGTEYAMDGR